jgi:hypothetical protein
MAKGYEEERDQKGGKLKNRLKDVRRRQKAQPRFGCDVMTFKMRLVKTKGHLEH